MPHVFNYEKNEFEQVHYQNVPQRNTDKISKRQRVPESMKFLLGLEEQETDPNRFRGGRPVAAHDRSPELV